MITSRRGFLSFTTIGIVTAASMGTVLARGGGGGGGGGGSGGHSGGGGRGHTVGKGGTTVCKNGKTGKTKC